MDITTLTSREMQYVEEFDSGMTFEQSREQWTNWLDGYGSGKFFDSFIRNVQGAKGTCVQCGENIYLDIVEGGGVPDWRTENGDYGCGDSPDTNADGTGGHLPERLQL